MTHFRSDDEHVNRLDIYTVGDGVVGDGIGFVPFLTNTGLQLVVDGVEQVVDLTDGVAGDSIGDEVTVQV